LIDVVSINMAGVRMVTDTANDNDCGNECSVLTLSDFVSRNAAFAGINGSYFCPASYDTCAGKTDSFDFESFDEQSGVMLDYLS